MPLEEFPEPTSIQLFPWLLALRRRWKDVGIYMGVQIAGVIAARLVYALTLWNVFNLQPSPGFGLLQAGLAEFLYTFMLCFVVLNVAASKVHAGTLPGRLRSCGGHRHLHARWAIGPGG